MDKFQDKYRISSGRLKHWDYGSNGVYFVTICTHNRNNYFGEIIVETQNLASLQSTEIGNVAHQYLLQIPSHFPFVELDASEIMPDHVHVIIAVNKPDYQGWNHNIFGTQSRNLGSIIRGYKAAVKKYATLNQIEFRWQAGYYDHVVRSEKDLFKIREYIMENPMKWEGDKNNVENLMM
jgi:putative transposase